MTASLQIVRSRFILCHRCPLVARWVSIYGFRIVRCMYGVFIFMYRIIPCHACIWVCMYVGRVFQYVTCLTMCVCLCVVCGACCGARLSRDRRGDGWCRVAVLRLPGPGAIIRKRRPPSLRTGPPRSGRHWPHNKNIINYMVMFIPAWLPDTHIH